MCLHQQQVLLARWLKQFLEDWAHEANSRKCWNCEKRSTLFRSGDTWTPSQSFKHPPEHQRLGSRLNTAHSVTQVYSKTGSFSRHHPNSGLRGCTTVTFTSPSVKKWISERLKNQLWASLTVSCSPHPPARFIQTYLSFRFSINCSIVTSSRRTKSDFPNSRPSSSAIPHLRKKLNKQRSFTLSRSVQEQKLSKRKEKEK